MRIIHLRMMRRALPVRHRRGKVQKMTRVYFFRFIAAGARCSFRRFQFLVAEEPTPAAVAGFNDYVGRVETRLAEQHKSTEDFLAPVDRARVKNGDVVIEHLTPATTKELPGALMHDWRGTAFVPGAKGEDFERVMRNFEIFPRIYSPEVLRASVRTWEPNHY